MKVSSSPQPVGTKNTVLSGVNIHAPIVNQLIG